MVKEFTLHPSPFKSREKGSLQDAPAFGNNVLRTLPPPHTPHQKPVTVSQTAGFASKLLLKEQTKQAGPLLGSPLLILDARESSRPVTSQQRRED